jgi:uncharacterized protein DUF4339
MAADWYCDINGEQHGPLTALQLKQLAVAGKLQPAHLVWKEGMTQRVPAKSVKGLFDSPAEAAGAKQSVPAPAAKPQEEDLVEFEMVEETAEDLVELEELEPVEEKPAKSKKEKEKEPEEDEPEPELIAEVAVIYREGLPDLDGPVSGTLQVESTGLRFLFETDDEDDEYALSFKKIDNVLEPVKGDFPPAMKKKALGKKIGGVAGKFAAGLVGKWMGGDAGKLVESAGKTAGNAAATSGNLGKPPRNRIAVLATVRKERCKIYFDTDGADRDEMNEEARLLYKQIQKARDKHAKLVEEGTTNINIVVNQAPAEEKEPSGSHKPAAVGKAAAAGGMGALAPATMTAGKPFRVMSGGRTRGPFSLAELRSMISSGQVGDADLIGVETWLPVATLGGLLAGGGAAPIGGGGGSFASDEEADDDEIIDDDAFEDVEDEEEDIEVNAPAAKSEDDAIPMDDEFQIG